VGVLKEPPVKAMIDNLSFLARTKKALRLTLQVHLTSTIQNTWDTVLKDRKLIVDLPSSTLPDGSKQSFVTLLEYAEEHLSCTHVFVRFRKDIIDRASLVRTFMFIGFSPVPPGKCPVTVCDDMMMMSYTIGDDDDSDSEFYD